MQKQKRTNAAYHTQTDASRQNNSINIFMDQPEFQLVVGDLHIKNGVSRQACCKKRNCYQEENNRYEKYPGVFAEYIFEIMEKPSAI